MPGNLFLASVFLSFTVLSVRLCAQENAEETTARWVTAEGSCLAANITPEEAMRRARDEARSKAVESVTGLEVNQAKYLKETEVNSGKGVSSFEDVYMKLNLSVVSGKIIEEESPRYSTALEGNVPRYTARIKAKVAVERGSPDKEFNAQIVLPSEVFYDRGNERNSDAVDFRLWASKDCYIYLFNIMSNDSVQLILPNEVITDNSYLINCQEQEYEKKIRSAGMKFPVRLVEGKKSSVEGLLLVALKDKIDFTSQHFGTDGLGIISTYKSALTDIMKWLIMIPVDRRTQCFSAFEIRKKYQ